MTDLSTTYLGLQLKNPIVPSSSPLMQKVDNLKKMQDAGAAAVILHSLFEEQIEQESHALDHFLSATSEFNPEAQSYFPELGAYNRGPEGYLDHVRKAKAALAIPVIASLNGYSSGGWVDYARQIEQAGADALELNMYYIAAETDLDSAAVEEMYLDLVRDVTTEITIPVTVKLSHHFSAFANMAWRIQRAGARGLVLFNRFYQPDFDLENLEVVHGLDLSSSYELRLRLRWIAILYDRVSADLAVTGGVHTAEDVIKSVMAGASIAMTTSALLHHGIGHVATMLAEMRDWLEAHEYESVRQMRGSMSQRAVPHPAAFERANYARVLQSYRL
ncbi:MAG: dihydroorotate dehydrogenase-like protein [Chloroflexi bacterium]|nr:dihydroorotate dehydrogenase-like protein [Chloroflexota bacterium]